MEVSQQIENGVASPSGLGPWNKGIHRNAYIYSYIKTQIDEYERTNKVVPDFQREYLETLKAYLAKHLFIIGKNNSINSNIQVFHTSPERPIASLFQERSLILPCISYGIEDNQASQQRRKPDFNFNIYSYFDPIKQRAERVISRAPKAVDLTLRINILSRYEEDINQLVEQIELMFDPHLTLPTAFGNSTPAFIIDWSDESVRVLPDRTEKIISKSCVILVEGYIPQKQYLMTSTGVIKEFKGNIET